MLTSVHVKYILGYAQSFITPLIWTSFPSMKEILNIETKSANRRWDMLCVCVSVLGPLPAGFIVQNSQEPN